MIVDVNMRLFPRVYFILTWHSGQRLALRDSSRNTHNVTQISAENLSKSLYIYLGLLELTKHGYYLLSLGLDCLVSGFDYFPEIMRRIPLIIPGFSKSRRSLYRDRMELLRESILYVSKHWREGGVFKFRLKIGLKLLYFIESIWQSLSMDRRFLTISQQLPVLSDEGHIFRL